MHSLVPICHFTSKFSASALRSNCHETWLPQLSQSISANKYKAQYLLNETEAKQPQVLQMEMRRTVVGVCNTSFSSYT